MDVLGQSHIMIPIRDEYGSSYTSQMDSLRDEVRDLKALVHSIIPRNANDPHSRPPIPAELTPVTSPMSIQHISGTQFTPSTSKRSSLQKDVERSPEQTRDLAYTRLETTIDDLEDLGVGPMPGYLPARGQPAYPSRSLARNPTVF